ncbi:hypothetical protein C4K18_4554 [Pseudomonas chlororaphis subsp. aurantiaca]|nr:hypothetical protein C4K18_4554 [Pseudomonas chlororaphis subsp. aurantiaca]
MFYGFTVRLVGAPFFLPGEKLPGDAHSSVGAQLARDDAGADNAI